MNYIGTEAGKPRLLIRETFEAWQYGPVEPNLYRFCADFGASPITDVFPYERIRDDYPNEYDMLKFVVDWGRDKSAGFLVGYTHMKGWAWDRLKQPSRKIPIPYSEIQEDYIAEKAKEDAARGYTRN